MLTGPVWQVGSVCPQTIFPSNRPVATAPLLAVPLFIAIVRCCHKNLGMGTIVAAELPYALGFFAVWPVVIVIWMLLGLPIGPGVSVYM